MNILNKVLQVLIVMFIIYMFGSNLLLVGSVLAIIYSIGLIGT